MNSAFMKPVEYQAIVGGYRCTVLRYPFPVFRRAPERKEVELRFAPRLTLMNVLREVALATNVGVLDLISQRRAVRICRARHIYFYAAKILTAQSFPQIGRFCGNRDHSTIMHGIGKVEKNRKAFEPELSRVLKAFPVRLPRT